MKKRRHKEDPHDPITVPGNLHPQMVCQICGALLIDGAEVVDKDTACNGPSDLAKNTSKRTRRAAEQLVKDRRRMASDH